MREKYSSDEAQSEAQELKKKIETGEAANYTEAEKILDVKYYQDLVWRLPEDEEIKQLGTFADVEILSDTPISAPTHLPSEKFLEFIKKSSNTRLVELGSATTVFSNDGFQKHLEESGVEEYIGVDLGIKDSDFWIRESAEPGKHLRLKAMHAEILAALHSFPVDYANIWMTGIQDRNVINYNDPWGFALLAELKRVVPENGFIYTDGGFMNQVLEKCSLEFAELYKTLSDLSAYSDHGHIIGRHDLTKDEASLVADEMRANIEKYRCAKDDPYQLGRRLGSYVVDAKELGIRIYLGRVEDWESPIVIVNTGKKRIVPKTNQSTLTQGVD
ncbi:MAG: hypothetical protein KBC81_01650 [Candidatus Pacebacteria bacterium]|nr:hypothetical protein [Candidatus Paceibacterota bacterium]